MEEGCGTHSDKFVNKMSDLIQIAGADDFNTAIQSGVVLVDFYADWCGPCRRLAPILEQIAVDFEGRAKIIKVDTASSGDLALRFGIESIPTLILFKNGEKIAVFNGIPRGGTLETALENAIG